MTSRTNGDSAGTNQGHELDDLGVALETRRQEAVRRYLNGAPIEQICREMGCSKSWLYKWKKRYQVTEPDWSQPRSRRPETTPSKTPEAIEAQLIRLHQTLSTPVSLTVSARRIRDHLAQHNWALIPSIRTIPSPKGGELTLSYTIRQEVFFSQVGNFQSEILRKVRPLLTPLNKGKQQ